MFWRLEAQGEVMSGRFVEEVAGEQFALPDALGLLQRCRRTADSQISLLAPSDPVVLSNLLFPDTKIPTHSGNRVLFRGGNPVAALVRGTYQPLADATSEERAYFERCLNEASPKLQAYGRRPRDSKRRQLHAAQLIGG